MYIFAEKIHSADMHLNLNEKNKLEVIADDFSRGTCLQQNGIKNIIIIIAIINVSVENLLSITDGAARKHFTILDGSSSWNFEIHTATTSRTRWLRIKLRRFLLLFLWPQLQSKDFFCMFKSRTKKNKDDTRLMFNADTCDI